MIGPNKERLNPTSMLAKTVEPFFTDKEKTNEFFRLHLRSAYGNFSMDFEFRFAIHNLYQMSGSTFSRNVKPKMSTQRMAVG